MPEERPAELLIFLGGTNTGKTSLVRKLVNERLKLPNGRALIITPDEEEWLNLPLVHERFPERISNYVGARRIIYDDPSAAERKAGQLNSLEYAEKYFSNGILVLDDAKAYMDNSRSTVLRRLCIRKRHRGRDLFVIAHSFDEVPPVLFSFYDRIILFYTQGNVESRKNFINNYDYVKKARERVNTKYMTNFPENEHHSEMIHKSYL